MKNYNLLLIHLAFMKVILLEICKKLIIFVLKLLIFAKLVIIIN